MRKRPYEAPGWARAQAFCDFAHDRLSFGDMQARVASQTFAGGQGVCREFARLAIAYCRCMNIPARSCTGNLCDIGKPEPYPPGARIASD